jgi:predicted CXXCH cytochrome family protein
MSKQRGVHVTLMKFLAVAAVFAGMAAQTANAGISNTKHNLGASNGNNVNFMTAGTNEICVFCHTPHASNQAISAPLWNKPASGATYTLYNTAYSSSIQGNINNTGISLACLSCHDGTQAMDTVINAPGSGGYNSAGALMAGRVWSGANQTNGKLAAGILTNLTTDLTNDHPIGIQFCGGGISTGSNSTAAASSGTCRDGDFNAAQNGLVAGTRVWWVDVAGVGTAGTRDKTDMQLYARAPVIAGDTTSGFYQPFVECASCHDPHVENVAGSNPTFLRTANTQSRVCLACHNK